MGDLVMIVLVLGFFGAGIGYVALCDRVIGPDVVPDSSAADPVTPAGVTADES
jgi:hypothetical protein